MLMNYSSMVTGSHIYALHMAIADLMLICTLPFQIIEISRSGIDGRPYHNKPCVLVQAVDTGTLIPNIVMRHGELDLEYAKYTGQSKS